MNKAYFVVGWKITRDEADMLCAYCRKLYDYLYMADLKDHKKGMVLGFELARCARDSMATIEIDNEKSDMFDHFSRSVSPIVERLVDEPKWGYYLLG